MTEISTTNNLTIIKDQAQLYLDAANRAVINSAETMEKGADMAKLLKSVAKKVEDIRVSKVKPLNDQVAAINKEHKDLIVPLEDAAKSVQSKMLAYTKEQERIAREEAAERQRLQEEEARLAAEAATAMDEDGNLFQEEIIIPEAPVVQAIAVPTLTRSNRGSVAGIRKTWTYEVTDIVKLANSRPDLIEAVSAKINAEIKGENGVREIPGLRIFQQETMSVR